MSDELDDSIHQILRAYKASGLMDAALMAFGAAEEHQAAGRTEAYKACREVAVAIKELAKKGVR